MSETKLYQGYLESKSYGEGDDILFISSHDVPLTDVLQDDISGKQVTARYWVCDTQRTKAEAEENTARQVMGDFDVEFRQPYSEVTGYLWTDENLKIGGHDLLEELKGNIDKWLILEIEVH